MPSTPGLKRRCRGGGRINASTERKRAERRSSRGKKRARYRNC